ncbi:peptidase C45 [Nocardia panacis]|uniref:Peptidase C45 n=1 Tax=Nocardia panacis TaxID=2340916 RepID=A0A3A4JXT7_9NOCA|nr:C45 family peptidase [Nocardia panacis]RJO75589.1 peptidase C45 [Nocardia panacis]
MFPIIAVSGGPRERGAAYGFAAAARIAVTIEGYRRIFAELAGLDWDAACRMAVRYEPAIGAEYLAEIAGIAAGAGVRYEEVLAVNCRTEIMFAGMVSRMRSGPVPECTAVAGVGSGSAVVGQNWDWLGFSAASVVVLAVRGAGGPDLVTVVEAGMLAKTGMNDRGIGVATNALVSEADSGAVGLPYHIALRRILDSGDLATATRVLTDSVRASSANYLVVDSTGRARNLECHPGGPSGVHRTEPVSDRLAHTNHFLGAAGEFDRFDRDGHLNSLCRLAAIERRSVSDAPALMAALRSHENAPDSVCMHARAGEDPAAAVCTVASVVMDLAAGRMWVAAGNPCALDYTEIDLAGLGMRFGARQ